LKKAVPNSPCACMLGRAMSHNQPAHPTAAPQGSITPLRIIVFAAGAVALIVLALRSGGGSAPVPPQLDPLGEWRVTEQTGGAVAWRVRLETTAVTITGADGQALTSGASMVEEGPSRALWNLEPPHPVLGAHVRLASGPDGVVLISAAGSMPAVRP